MLPWGGSPMSRGWRVLVLPVVMACVIGLPAMSQGQQPQQLGKIIGSARVSRGDFPVHPVLISLEMRGTPIGSAYCDEQGRFSFNGLVANEYRVTVDDDSYDPYAEIVRVDPATAPMNFVQITLVPRSNNKKDPVPGRVAGSNPYLVDPAEYNRQFPKKTRKEFDKGVEADHTGKTDDAIQHYLKALSYKPSFYPAHHKLA